MGKDIRRDGGRNSMAAKDVRIWCDVALFFSSWSAGHGWGGRWVKKLSVPVSDEGGSFGEVRYLERILRKGGLLVCLPLTRMIHLEKSDI